MVKNIVLGCVIVFSYSLTAMENNAELEYQEWVWHNEDPGEGERARLKRKYKKRHQVEKELDFSDSKSAGAESVAPRTPINKMAIEFIIN